MTIPSLHGKENPSPATALSERASGARGERDQAPRWPNQRVAGDDGSAETDARAGNLPGYVDFCAICGRNDSLISANGLKFVENQALR